MDQKCHDNFIHVHTVTVQLKSILMKRLEEKVENYHKK